MARTNQRGSILEFIIIGVVLALLLVGGAYFVRRTFMSSADRNEEPTVSVEEADDTDSIGSTDDEATESSEDTPEVFTPETENQSTQDENTEEHTSEHQGDAPENLPQTGPADTLVSSLLLGGMVTAVAAYKRSRGASASL